MAVDPLMLLETRGGQPYGEEITQLEHALQCARLAKLAAASPPLIVAALFHDVGHLLEPASASRPTADHRHEIISAKLLARWFGPEVTEPVRLHVMAKRYLARDPKRPLSGASLHSLALQGGPLDDEHAREFEMTPFAKESLLLRGWDDEAKIIDLETPSLDSWREIIDGCKL